MSITAQVLGAAFIGVAGILLLFGLWEEGYGIRILHHSRGHRGSDLE